MTLDFLGIGAQKAGTTWLYEMLKTHPEISFPGGKEIHYWDKKVATVPVSWYLSVFARNSDKRCGEITPKYALLDPPLIKRIYDINPGLKLIFIMRNPITRAWSGALMRIRHQHLLYEDLPDRWFIDFFHSDPQPRLGDYRLTLENWSTCFPSDQVLLMRFEDIRSNPGLFLQRCICHIGLPDKHRWDFSYINKPVHAGTRRPIRPSLLPVLKELFSPKIDALSQFLGFDCSYWYRDL